MPARLSRPVLAMLLGLATVFALVAIVIQSAQVRGSSAGSLVGQGDATLGASGQFTVSLPLVRVDGPANLIQTYGHGVFVFRYGQKVELTKPLIKTIQEAWLADILKQGSLGQLSPDVQKAIDDAQSWIKQPNATVDEGIHLRGAIADAVLQVSGDSLTALYGGRNAALLTHIIAGNQDWFTTIHPSVLEILRRMGTFRPIATTTYIEDCRAQDVPIPPDWAETGTDWRLQGTLGTNILQPGAYAGVWTYSDPSLRGACIALPRGSGDGDSLAGIICQSAVTGHACFWDNIRRQPGPEIALGWRGVRLEIATLKDGSNLESPCTDCHVGNNVYLISPDDATWAKVLRGPLAGTTGNFTTVVESSTDNRGGHPRYVPMVGNPPQAGWENRLPSSSGCAGACHEMPATGVLSRWPPAMATPAAVMPPACATGGVVNCYGTP
ncbi:MAG: hypothetical protein ACRC1H_03335 [Caldilineaceae bacterium]